MLPEEIKVRKSRSLKPRVRKCDSDFVLGKSLKIITLLLLTLTNILVTKKCFKEKGDGLNIYGSIFLIIFQLVSINSLINYAFAAWKDPGSIPHIHPPRNYFDDKDIKQCFKCPGKPWKPPRAHHCRVCRRCVFRMDHHCDWVDNCVGIKNQKNFMLFLIYTIVKCLMAFVFFLLTFVFWLQDKDAKGLRQQMSWENIGCGIIGILAVFFIIFCCDFLMDQIEGIKTNQTTVESYKELLGKRVYFN